MIQKQTGRNVFVAMTIVLGFGATGCGVAIDSPPSATPGQPGSTTPAPSGSRSSTPSAPGPTPTGRSSSEGVLLHEIPSESGRGSGQRTSATIDGDGSRRVYAESTALWVGCDGEPDNVNFALDGKFRTVRGLVGFRTGVGRGVVAEVVVYGDGAPITAFRVDHDGGFPMQVVVDGVDVLSFTVTRAAGTCSPSEESYLVIADGVLR
ncbi:MAG: hypothetical protein ACRCXL_00045 [Dermatophilaceae bacterium]